MAQLLLKISCLLLIMQLFQTGYAQRNNPMFAIASDLYSNEAINVFDLRSKDPINSTYWLDSWHDGELITKGGVKIDEYKLKYDVVNHNIDIQYDDSVKVLPGDLVREFYLFTSKGKRRFVDLNIYTKVDFYQLGFFEVMKEGGYTLLAKMETELLRANYVPTHDMGRQQDSFVKKESFFLLKDGELIRIPKKKKEAMQLLDRLRDGGSQFLKDQKIKTKNRGDLLKLVDYLNG